MRVVLAAVFALAAVNAYAKDDAAPLGLPTSADLKTKCGLDDEQVKKVDAVYAEYKSKVADVQKKIDDGDKKGKKEAATLKAEIIAKIHDLGKDDDQKKKIDEAMPVAKKKKTDK
jgi:hypothetical protein